MQTKDIEKIVYEYGDDLYRFCCHLTYSKDLAEELYQETFLKIVELKGKIEETGNPKSYVLGVAVNLWRNYVRKRKRRQEILPEADFDKVEGVLDNVGQDVLDNYVKKEMSRNVRAVVNNLSEKQRLVVVLYYGQDMTTKQIASILHIPKGTVMSRLAKARENIKKEMEVRGYEV